MKSSLVILGCLVAGILVSAAHLLPAFLLRSEVAAGVLFALLFRYLPDARLPWRRVTWGGVITALLFALGKWVIGIYLSSGNIGGAYGAAGSLVVLLVWVYYSGAIFFFGAEVVHAWALERGDHVQLSQHTEQRS